MYLKRQQRHGTASPTKGVPGYAVRRSRPTTNNYYCLVVTKTIVQILRVGAEWLMLVFQPLYSSRSFRGAQPGGVGQRKTITVPAEIIPRGSALWPKELDTKSWWVGRMIDYSMKPTADMGGDDD